MKTDEGLECLEEAVQEKNWFYMNRAPTLPHRLGIQAFKRFYRKEKPSVSALMFCTAF